MVLLTEVLPTESSSSSLTHNHCHNYDVFLSFRGADTRNRFTAHLYEALVRADYITFLDDEEIETGEELKPELDSAIKSSRSSVIVLSKNYASSTWCLDELVLILEQKRSSNQIVIPIFYDVEPTDVRKQQSTFGDAMEKHKQRMEAETDAEKRNQWFQKIELWKMALTQVADLKGIDAKGRMETKVNEEIVYDINHRLGAPLRTLPQLIGTKYHIEDITLWLKNGSTHTADILTILGMAGIGKTSLANYVYELHRHEYTSCSFVGDISRRCADGKDIGLLDVQKQLCDDISKTSLIQVHDVSRYTSKIEKALACKKVLLVLDDVDSLDQLDALLGTKGFHSGSKIIVTTKDASLVERCALFKTKVNPKLKECKLEGLSIESSMELLCHHAFMRNNPNEGYGEVSRKLASYCEGHPLALEVLGKSLHKRDVAYWEECIKGLKKEPLSSIEKAKKALQMSFDSLMSENDKELFKHIACFFVGNDKDLTETILKACDLNTTSGIINLKEKCFLSITLNNELKMHSLIQEMGRDLVRQESLNRPWERSRLWCHEESFEVLKQKKGTENILGLVLDMRMLEKKKLGDSLQLKTDALCKMDKLKLLQLNFLEISGSYKNISKELRWLCMHGFRFKSIPSELPMKNLVVLDMSHSNIQSFDMSYSNSQRLLRRPKLGLIRSSSEDKRLLGSLKILDMSFCKKLHNVGGFSEMPALERLIVRKCISLMDVCESIEQCVELLHIDMSYCYKLKKLPKSMRKLKIKRILLDGLSCRECQTETIPNDLKLTVTSLLGSLRSLSLAENNLSNESFPEDFCSLSMLEELCLDGNPIVSMPNFVRTLPRLISLHMNMCDELVSVENLPRTLRNLSVNTLLCPCIRTTIGDLCISKHSSPDGDDIVKTQALADVEEKVLHNLGWTNLGFIKEKRPSSFDADARLQEFQTQIFYRFGVYNTIYEGEEMPNWIERSSEGASISFTIPPSPKKLLGLNLCCVEDSFFDIPVVEIKNITTSQTWRYSLLICLKVPEGKCFGWLSHWKFGSNEMKAGDHITITVENFARREDQTKCGISLVYDEDGKTEGKEEVMYYKSWKRINDIYCCPLQLTSGEYILNSWSFTIESLEYACISPIWGTKIRFKGKSFSKPSPKKRSLTLL